MNTIANFSQEISTDFWIQFGTPGHERIKVCKDQQKKYYFITYPKASGLYERFKEFFFKPYDERLTTVSPLLCDCIRYQLNSGKITELNAKFYYVVEFFKNKELAHLSTRKWEDLIQKTIPEQQARERAVQVEALKNKQTTISCTLPSTINQALRRDPNTADVTIQCQNKERKVHSVILKQYTTSFFERFFSKEWEKPGNFLNLTEYSSFVVDYLLDLLYQCNDVIKITLEEATELLKLVDFLLLHTLLPHCQKIFKKLFTQSPPLLIDHWLSCSKETTMYKICEEIFQFHPSLFIESKGISDKKKEQLAEFFLQNQSQANLGYCHLTGFGLPVNLQEGFNLIQEAIKVNSKDVFALNILGYCYQTGNSEIGIKPDGQQAIEYYTSAADLGYACAQNNLGACYQKQVGVKQNDQLAVQYYQLAANQGYVPALHNLARCYEQGGIGIKPDDQQAANCYQLAVNAGDTEALSKLGYCYQHGIGVQKKNEKKAVECYTKGADLGDANARYNLAYCYELGIGVDQDEDKALDFYSLAANQGHSHAITSFQRLSQLRRSSIASSVQERY